jgi:hypothetical protein
VLANENPAPEARRAGLGIEAFANERSRYPNTAIVEIEQEHWREIVDAFALHGVALDESETAWLHRHGVQLPFDRDPIRASGILMRGARFDFAADCPGEVGKRALLLLARDSDGIPCDVVAWSARERCLATWRGMAYALGSDPLAAFGFATRIFLEPLAWLRAGREGLLIVNARRAAIELLNTSLEAEDAFQAAALRRALTLPVPSIRVARAATSIRRAA